MFIRNNKRFNIYAKHVIDDVTYPSGICTDPEVRNKLNVIEIPDPVRMPEETHYNQEIDEPPYLISTPKPKEQVDSLLDSKIVERITSLEANQPRALREAILYGDKTKLQEIEDAIKLERDKLSNRRK
jgi:hypothetical protein